MLNTIKNQIRTFHREFPSGKKWKSAVVFVTSTPEFECVSFNPVADMFDRTCYMPLDVLRRGVRSEKVCQELLILTAAILGWRLARSQFSLQDLTNRRFG